jgi:hypothetical protein
MTIDHSDIHDLKVAVATTIAQWAARATMHVPQKTLVEMVMKSIGSFFAQKETQQEPQTHDADDTRHTSGDEFDRLKARKVKP